MSIAPVQTFPPDRTGQPAYMGHTQAIPESRVTEEATPPVSGTVPKQETSAAENVSATYELPQDVVEVHQDPEIKNQIIVQYLDNARNVILQVPSNQELSVERGIAQDFQQAAKLRESQGSVTEAPESEKTHGN